MGLQGLSTICPMAPALFLVPRQATVMNAMLLAHGTQKPCETCLGIQFSKFENDENLISFSLKS